MRILWRKILSDIDLQNTSSTDTVELLLRHSNNDPKADAQRQQVIGPQGAARDGCPTRRKAEMAAQMNATG